MAFAVDQTDTTTGSGTSITLNLVGVAAGSLIVVCVASYKDTTPNVTGITDGTAYTAAFSSLAFYAAGGYEEQLDVYYLDGDSNSGGDRDIVITNSQSTDQMDGIAVSFTGVESTAPINGTPVTDIGSSAAASSGEKSDSVSGDLIIGCFAADGSAGTSYGAGGGWLSPAGAHNGQNLTWKTASDATDTATCSVASGDWGAAILAFSAAAGGSIIPQITHHRRQQRRRR